MIAMTTLERFPEPSAQGRETREFFVSTAIAHTHGDYAAADRRTYYDAEHPIPKIDTHYNFTEEEW